MTAQGTTDGTGRGARTCRLALFMFTLTGNPHLWAHPISLTSGQAVVGADAVRVQLEVLAEDFFMFYGLIPNWSNRVSAADIRSAMERHKTFLLRDLAIRNVRGQRLQGQVVKVARPAFSDEGIDVGDLMDYAFTYHLKYPVDTRPTHLTFGQSFGSEDIPVPAVLELEVIQQGMANPDRVVLTNDGSVETFEFQWRQPGRVGEPSPEQAWERRRQERRERQLGIGSYSAVYAFIYIQNNEVRIEILIPLLTLETWVQVDREDREFLEVAEQQAARETLARFLCRRNIVTIDGVEVKPTLQRLDFYGVDFRDFAMRAPQRRLSAFTARVGAILSYPAERGPKEVEIHWRLFNAAVYTARAAVYAYDETLRHQFTAYKPKFTWTNPGVPPSPRITPIQVGRAPRDLREPAAREIVAKLLRNVYRAFDYRTEGDTYDALACSVFGDLLTDIYLQVRKSLIMQEQGGAVSKVKDVRIVECAVTQKRRGAAGTTVRVKWTVDGTVEHWGHIHTRVNQYEADFTIRAVDNAWKIVNMEVIDQQRLRYQVNVRRL